VAGLRKERVLEALHRYLVSHWKPASLNMAPAQHRASDHTVVRSALCSPASVFAIQEQAHATADQPGQVQLGQQHASKQAA
jgi:hypothetical protein